MSNTTTQVANSFVTEFFERLAKNPSTLGELYYQKATITVSDFEYGVTEAAEDAIPNFVRNWAKIIEGCQITVESVSSAPTYGGLMVFAAVSATGRGLEQHFQFTTTLEVYSSRFTPEGYCIRHQVISRVGALDAPEPVPVPVEEPVVAAPPPPPPAPKVEKVVEAPKEVPAPAPAAPVVEAAKVVAEPVAAAPAEKKSSAPMSWAALASAGKSAEAAKPIRIVARSGPAPAAAAVAAAAPAKKEAPAAKADAAKRPVRRPEPVGDRLMFNTTAAVTDEEIRAAIGAMAASLVSLRNCSDKGRVFLDFALNVAAFDDLSTQEVLLGENKTKINIYRQHDRH